MERTQSWIFDAARYWLPLACASTLFAVLNYATVQQLTRASANDPQIQLAEDAAAALAERRQPFASDAGEKINIARSLAPFLIVFDAQGQPVASNGQLDGRLPAPPPSAILAARQSGDNSVSWQPRASVRTALVIVHFAGKSEGFVAAGRSLREAEKRESYAFKAAAFVWLLSLVTTLALCLFFAWLGARTLK